MHHAFSDGIGLVQMFCNWSEFKMPAQKIQTWSDIFEDVKQFVPRFIKGGKYTFKA